jgi:hypothetical protein
MRFDELPLCDAVLIGGMAVKKASKMAQKCWRVLGYHIVLRIVRQNYLVGSVNELPLPALW